MCIIYENCLCTRIEEFCFTVSYAYILFVCVKKKLNLLGKKESNEKKIIFLSLVTLKLDAFYKCSG